MVTIKQQQKQKQLVETPKVIIEERIIYMGRGGGSNDAEGNKDFRDVVKELKPDYKKSTREGKKVIIERINETLLENGYNLAKEDGTLLPKDQMETKFRRKTSQALRDSGILRVSKNNPELVNHMLGQIREKLKSHNQSLFTENENITQPKTNDASDVEVTDGATFQNNASKRQRVAYPGKVPRDKFSHRIYSVEAPKGFTEEDYEKKMREGDDLFSGRNFVEEPEGCRKEDFDKEMKAGTTERSYVYNSIRRNAESWEELVKTQSMPNNKMGIG